MSACLTAQQVAALVAGQLAERELSSAEEHVATCPECRERVRVATAPVAARTRQMAVEASVSAESQQRPRRPEIPGYQILSQLHRGGQGIVFRAVQEATKRTVALKVLLGGEHATERRSLRFEREIGLAATLQHPNIVTIFDSGIAGETMWYAMEYVHGRTLGEHLAETEPQPLYVLSIFRKLCAAIAHAHRKGVIHRDLKPSNVIIDARGEPHVVDFGIARAAGLLLTAGGTPVTETGDFLGTLAYASPEQARGDLSSIDVRTDVYSLGVMLYEALTGQFPYDVSGCLRDVIDHINQDAPARPSSLASAIDVDTETVVMTALAKDRSRRYGSAGEFHRDLESLSKGRPVRARRESGWYVLGKQLRKKRSALGGAAAMLALVLAVWGMTTMLQAELPHPEISAGPAPPMEMLPVPEDRNEPYVNDRGKARFLVTRYGPEFAGGMWQRDMGIREFMAFIEYEEAQRDQLTD